MLRRRSAVPILRTLPCFWLAFFFESHSYPTINDTAKIINQRHALVSRSPPPLKRNTKDKEQPPNKKNIEWKSGSGSETEEEEEEEEEEEKKK
jgi:hypothetical protein